VPALDRTQEYIDCKSSTHSGLKFVIQ
jgi:hypothetical protein